MAHHSYFIYSSFSTTKLNQDFGITYTIFWNRLELLKVIQLNKIEYQVRNKFS